MTKVLVTGANGFVGKWLCSQLLQSGFGVKAGTKTKHTKQMWLDLCETVIPDSRAVFDTSQFELSYTGEISSKTSWAEHLKDVDVIIHLAARVHMMNEDKEKSLKVYDAVNNEGTAHLAREAVSAGVKQFILLSSIKVSGDETQDGHPFTIQDRDMPSGNYGISKWKAEQSLVSILEKEKTTYTIIRPTLVYGPGVKANFLALIKLLQYGLPLPFKGAHNKRSMIYVENLVDLIISTMLNEKAKNQTFLAADCTLSTAALMRKICVASGRKSRLFYFPPKGLAVICELINKENIYKRLFNSLEVDDSHLKSTIGWNAPISIDKAINKTVKWCLKRL